MRTFSNKLHCFCTFEKAQNPKGYKVVKKSYDSSKKNILGKDNLPKIFLLDFVSLNFKFLVEKVDK